MSSSNRTGAPQAPTSSWNPLQRINRSRQHRAAAKAERQVNKQWLDAQRRRLQPAPTLPASPPCGGRPLEAGARLGGPAYGGLPLPTGASPLAGV